MQKQEIISTIDYIMKNRTPNAYELASFVLSYWESLTSLPFEEMLNPENVLENVEVNLLLENYNISKSDFEKEFNNQLNK